MAPPSYKNNILTDDILEYLNIFKNYFKAYQAWGVYLDKNFSFVLAALLRYKLEFNLEKRRLMRNLVDTAKPADVFITIFNEIQHTAVWFVSFSGKKYNINQSIIVNRVKIKDWNIGNKMIIKLN